MMYVRHKTPFHTTIVPTYDWVEIFNKRPQCSIRDTTLSQPTRLSFFHHACWHNPLQGTPPYVQRRRVSDRICSSEQFYGLRKPRISPRMKGLVHCDLHCKPRLGWLQSLKSRWSTHDSVMFTASHHCCCCVGIDTQILISFLSLITETSVL